jgi:2'-5' RNA ligase
VGRFLAGNNLFATEAFPVSEFHLYSSELTSKGAFHALEASYPLL